MKPSTVRRRNWSSRRRKMMNLWQLTQPEREGLQGTGLSLQRSYSSRDMRSRSFPDFLETTVATLVNPIER